MQAQPCDCSITQYRNMAMWITSNIDIGQSLNSRDSFPRWEFKNPAPTSCSPGPILWPPTISFELHVEMAEEIDLEMCSYGQLCQKFKCSVTLINIGFELPSLLWHCWFDNSKDVWHVKTRCQLSQLFSLGWPNSVGSNSEKEPH